MDKISEIKKQVQKKVEGATEKQRKIRRAERWLHANFDRLVAEGKDDIALEALNHYEKLFDK